MPFKSWFSTTGVKIWYGATSIFRLHIGLNSIVTLVVLIAIIYKFVLEGALLEALNLAIQPAESLTTVQSFGLGVLASIIAALVFGIAGVFLFNWYGKIRLTGDYAAFSIEDDGKEVPFGKVSIRYHPLSSTLQHTPVKLRLTNVDIVMEGDGMIIDNRYLTGQYTEIGQIERRRSGVFMYEIDGNGREWSGKYIFVDPGSDKPNIGEAKWRRK